MDTHQVVLLALALVVLGGCGQKGPLMLPDDTAEQPAEIEESTGNDEAADDESQNDG